MVEIVETPQKEWKRKTKNLRSWALKTMKESVGVLVIYGIWSFLFGYAYANHGYSGLAITLGVVMIYKIDRVVKR